MIKKILEKITKEIMKETMVEILREKISCCMECEVLLDASRAITITKKCKDNPNKRETIYYCKRCSQKNVK